MKYRTQNDKKKDLFSVKRNSTSGRKPLTKKLKKLSSKLNKKISENFATNFAKKYHLALSEKKVSNLFQLECDSKIFNDKNIISNYNNNIPNNNYICNNFNVDNIFLNEKNTTGNNLLINLNILKNFNITFLLSNFVQNYNFNFEENLKNFYEHFENLQMLKR
jgi:hypothetical protein